MPQWIATFFGRFGYAALFIGIFLENLGIPVPGETVLLAGGFFAKRGVLRLAIVVPIAIVAAILGDNFGYWIGRRGGRKFVEKRGKYIGLSPKRLAAVEKYFHEHGPRTIFFARFVSGIRVVAAITAGVSRIPWREFVVYNAAGAVVWGTAMALLGYVFGQSWPLLERWVGRGGVVIAAVVVTAILFAILRQRRERIAAWISEWLPGTLTLHELWLLACSLVAVGLLAKITEDVVARESTRFDDAIAAAVTDISFPGFGVLMKIANAIGSGPFDTTVTVLALAFLWYRRDWISLELLAGLVIVIQILDAIFKNLVHRVRPEPLHAMTNVYKASFPSGHAMNAVAIYGFIAFLISRGHPVLRRVFAVVVVVLALAIGLSRVYLQLHWATDVLGGYCMGLLLLSVAVFWSERLEAA